MGQDLHDTLGHVFVSLSLKSELAYKLIDKDQEKAKMKYWRLIRYLKIP